MHLLDVILGNILTAAIAGTGALLMIAIAVRAVRVILKRNKEG